MGLWFPFMESSPGAQPHVIHSYWYIADTPGPALLGLPACEKLAVVQVNCAVKATQLDRSPTGTITTQAARTTKPPATRTLKSKCIKSTDDLMRDFPDRFTGIGKFPGKYKICLCPDACTQKMSNCIMSQGQGAPGKNGSPGSNHPCRPAHRLGIINHLYTKGKWQALPMSRSTWPQQSNLPWSPQDAYCRRNGTQVHKFALLHQAWCMPWILVHSPWWRIKPLDDLQQPLWEVVFPVTSLWPGLLTGHLPEEDGPVPQRVPWMYWNCQWHRGTWSHWGRTWCSSM